MNQGNDTYREQMEIRLVALLLGEASEFEQAELRDAMEKDASLAAFYNEMKATVGMVQEASKKFTETPTPTTKPTLSPARREKLLASFKVVKPKAFAQPRNTKRWVIRLGWAAGLALVAYLSIFTFGSLQKTASSPRASASWGSSNRRTAAKVDSSLVPQEAAGPVPVQSAENSFNLGLNTQPQEAQEQTRLQIFLPPGGNPQPSDVPIVGQATGDRGDAQQHGFQNQLGTAEKEIIANRKRTLNGSTAAAGLNAGTVFRGGVGGGGLGGINRDQSAAGDVVSDKTPAAPPTQELYFQSPPAASPAPATLAPSAPPVNAPVSAAERPARPVTRELTESNKKLPAKGLPPGNQDAFGRRSQLSERVAESPAAPAESKSASIRTFNTDLPRVAGKEQTDSAAVFDRDITAQTSDARDGTTARARSPIQVEHPSGSSVFLPVPSSSVDRRHNDLVQQTETAQSAAALESRSKSTAGNVLLKDSKEITPIAPPADSNASMQFDAVLKQETAAGRRNVATADAPKLYESLAKSREPLDSKPALAVPSQKTPETPAINVEELKRRDEPAAKPKVPIPTPQPETSTAENAFSTFSLNVSDVSFKLAEASLQNNVLPDPASIRVEEFVNAFNYRDPAPLPGARLAFAWERAHYPFAHNRDILRLGIQTAARGRDAQKPLNLVILLDNSGSMERPDRVAILREALKVLARQLHPQDRISIIAFARTARLWVDGMAGGEPNGFLAKVLDLNPDGGTNLEEAMNLGYETAARHFMPNGVNRVILLTDGAANLGNVEPEDLKKKVIVNRQKGIALDCYGIGWEGYNDDLLEVLSHNGDGRYGFLNSPEQAGPEFADQLAGALNVAAADVKTQVEFNPARVTSWRQIGYARHQLTKEQFRDNTVDAAEIAAAEQGNALYVIEVNQRGTGPLGTVRVRFKVPETGEYIEQSWELPYQSQVCALENATPAMRLATTAAAFGEWLSTSPYAAEVTPSRLQPYLTGIPETFSPDPRPTRLATMIRQAQGLIGK